MPADYSGSTISWGDGTATTSATNTNATNSPLLGGGHTYAVPGTYTILVTAQRLWRRECHCFAHGRGLLDGNQRHPGQSNARRGQPRSITLATFIDQDGNTNPGGYQVQATWAGQNLSAAVNYTNGAFTVQASPPPRVEEGSYPLTVRITDAGDGATAKVSGTALVSDAGLNATPVNNLTAQQGKSFSGTLASFFDANSVAPTSDFTALVDFGDGSPPTAASVSGGSGTFSVTPSSGHVWKQAGTFTIIVTIIDKGGSRATVSDRITVTPSALTVNVSLPSFIEGAASGSIAVATFSDSDNNLDPSHYSNAQVTWGDGSNSPGTVSFANGSLSIQVPAGHTYTEEASAGSNFPVTVSLNDDDGVSGSGQGTATVQDAALSGSGTPVTATAGTPFTAPLASFLDADPAGTAGDYTAVVTSWGDNIAPSGGSIVAGSGQNFLIKGGHKYTATGTFDIIVSLTDAGGASTTLSTTATVSAATQSLSTPAINAVEGQSFSGNVALFTPADPNASYQATIGWGDGSSGPGTLTSNGAGAFWISALIPMPMSRPWDRPMC